MDGVRDIKLSASIPELYRNTLKALSSVDVHDAASYKATRECTGYLSKGTRRLFWEIELAFAAQMSRLLRTQSAEGNCVTAAMETPRRVLSGGMRSQLTVYTGQTFMITDGIDVDTSDWDSPEDHGFDLNYRHAELLSMPDVGPPLATAYEYWPEVRRGIIIPVPRSVDVVDPRAFHHQVRVMEMEARGIGVAGFDDEAAKVFRETTRSTDLPKTLFCLDERALSRSDLSFGIRVPSLAALPPTTARRLRDDYRDEFLRFQASLVKISAAATGESGEPNFKELLQEAEESVRLLKESMDRLRHKYSSLARISILMCVFLCLGSLQPDVAAAIQSALSGVLAASVFKLLEVREQLEGHLSDPLFFGVRALESLTAQGRATPSNVPGRM